MTLATTNNRISYTGNGVTTDFSFPYKFNANADLKVYQNGVLKSITTHYTVTGAGSASGGTVTFIVAPPTNEVVVIYRDPSITQSVDLIANDSLPAETLEDAFDRTAMIDQRLSDRIDRSLVMSETDTSGASLLLPAPSASALLGWNNASNGLQNYEPGDFATVILGANWNLDTFSGDGATTAFTLAKAPGHENNTQVVIGTSYQRKGTYTVVGTIITFSTAPGSGSNNIEVSYATSQTYNITSISAGAVGTTELANNAVTPAKFQTITTQRFMGRNTAGIGNLEQLTLTQLFGWAGTVTPATGDRIMLQDVSNANEASYATLSSIVALGTIKQIVYAELTTSGTTIELIPVDDTIPQITEGFEILTCTITPQSATSYLLIQVTANLQEDTNLSDQGVVAAVFRDATANALAAILVGQGTPTSGSLAALNSGQFNFIFRVAASSVAATTFRLRVGGEQAGTYRWNGFSTARRFGGVWITSMTITEISA